MLWSMPILEGFVRSHRGNLVLMSPRQFALTGWFVAGKLSDLVLSRYANQSHNCTKLNFCRVTLLANVNYKRPPLQNTEIFPTIRTSRKWAPLISEHDLNQGLAQQLLLSIVFNLFVRDHLTHNVVFVCCMYYIPRVSQDFSVTTCNYTYL